jgi:hypothetical protein
LNPNDQNNPNQKWDKLWDELIYSLLKGDEIPLALLYRYDATSTPWTCHHVNISRLANVASITSTTNTSLVVLQTLQQTTQYNKYCIWNLKLGIQIKLSMALLKLTDHDHYWIMVLRKEANFFMSNHIIQSKLLVVFHPSAFECLCIPGLSHLNHKCKASLCSNLAYTLRGMAPHPMQSCQEAK